MMEEKGFDDEEKIEKDFEKEEKNNDVEKEEQEEGAGRKGT